MTRSTAPRIARLIAACLALALAGAPAAAQSAADRAAAFAPAAFVDGEVITAWDVDQRQRLLDLLGRPSDRRAGLQMMIEDRLKRDAAREAGVAVSDDEIVGALSRFARAQGVDADGLRTALRRAGISGGTMREFAETEVLWTSLIRRDYGTRSAVSDLELDEEIAAEGLDRRVSWQVRELAVPFGADEAGVRARMRTISGRLNQGEDFAALARQFSRAPSARQGGLVGWVPSDRVPEAVRAELEALGVGASTPPLPVPGGLVILQKADERVEELEMTPEMREQVRLQILDRRLSRLAEGRLQELRAEAYVDVRE